MEKVSANKSFKGTQEVYQHYSETLKCPMNFAVYIPEHDIGDTMPVIYWLSGLTCTEQNFITKAGAQQYASQHKLIVVAPDTSPRGEDIANDDTYDLGQGAGFYLNATQQPWSEHYQMYDYILHELRQLVDENFPSNRVQSIMGHSMGGLGALVLGLRNPEIYRSISAFSPIVSPSNCPWGEKAFSNYLGQDKTLWKAYDPAELIKNYTQHQPILIDQGLNDEFFETQLKTQLLLDAAPQNDQNLQVNMREGYDHSYYFIASFIKNHFEFHVEALNQ